jgi:hypothetical protein
MAVAVLGWEEGEGPRKKENEKGALRKEKRKNKKKEEMM